MTSQHVRPEASSKDSPALEVEEEEQEVDEEQEEEQEVDEEVVVEEEEVVVEEVVRCPSHPWRYHIISGHIYAEWDETTSSAKAKPWIRRSAVQSRSFR